jgi:hypothetical protein
MAIVARRDWRLRFRYLQMESGMKIASCRSGHRNASSDNLRFILDDFEFGLERLLDGIVAYVAGLKRPS